MEDRPAIDTKEFELPSTLFSRDIETRVIQSIVLQCLCKIEGVGLIGGNILETLLGRAEIDRVKGIFVEQDSKNHQVKVKVEINVQYGVSIPKKAEEVQSRIVEEIIHLTGLHVATVHVVVKGLLVDVKDKKDKVSAYSKDEELDSLEVCLNKS